MSAASQPVPAAPSLLADLITLTKPRIISLLLVTTVTYGEDQSRIRHAHLRQNFAWLNRFT